MQRHGAAHEQTTAAQLSVVHIAVTMPTKLIPSLIASKAWKLSMLRWGRWHMSWLPGVSGVALPNCWHSSSHRACQIGTRPAASGHLAALK